MHMCTNVGDKVWNVLEVLNVLQALVDKSGIVAELEADGGAALFASDGYLPNQSNVLRMLGYFSLVRATCSLAEKQQSARHHTGQDAVHIGLNPTGAFAGQLQHDAYKYAQACPHICMHTHARPCTSHNHHTAITSNPADSIHQSAF